MNNELGRRYCSCMKGKWFFKWQDAFGGAPLLAVMFQYSGLKCNVFSVITGRNGMYIEI